MVSGDWVLLSVSASQRFSDCEAQFSGRDGVARKLYPCARVTFSPTLALILKRTHHKVHL